MDKLISLAAALKAGKVGNPEAIEAFAEDGTVQISESVSGPDLLLFYHAYTGVIALDGVTGSLAAVLGQVVAWLTANGEKNDVIVGWSGEPVDRNRSDMEIRLSLEEEAHYVPAEPGYAGRDKITWHGADYKLGGLAASVATALDAAGDGVTASVVQT